LASPLVPCVTDSGTVTRAIKPGYIALTMFSVTFLASPSSIMVLSR
jgi:hypothetical protein